MCLHRCQALKLIWVWLRYLLCTTDSNWVRKCSTDNFSINLWFLYFTFNSYRSIYKGPNGLVPFWTYLSVWSPKSTKLKQFPIIIHKCWTSNSPEIVTVYVQHLHIPKVDYLPYMFLYEYNIQTIKPMEVSLYDILLYPFDNYIWSIAIVLTMLEIIIIMIMELMWYDTTGFHSTPNYIYEGTVLVDCHLIQGQQV
jgi:hypothetical protein